MTDQMPNDFFPEDRDDTRHVESHYDEPPRRGGGFGRFLLVILLMGLGAGGAYGYLKFFKHGVDKDVPVISAEGETKHRPDNPGGIDIPHQDVTVFQKLEGKKPKGQVAEHLLAPPERPRQDALVPPPKPENLTRLKNADHAPAPVASKQGAVVKSAPSSPLDDLVKKVSAEPAPSVKINKSVPKSVPVAQEKAAQQTTDSENVTTATEDDQPTTVADEEKPAPQAAKNMVRIQLAATPDAPAARKLVAQLQKKYDSLLQDAKLHSVRADLGDKGIFYRVQSSPMSDGQASQICAALKNKQGCLIVRK